MTGLLRRVLRGALGAFVAATALGFAAVTLAQRFASVRWPWLELTRFVPWYWLAVPAAAALAAALWLGRAWLVPGALPALLLATLTTGLAWTAPRDAPERLRLMTFNAKVAVVRQTGSGLAAIAAEVARQAPDILVMQDADGLVVHRAAPASIGGPPLFGLPNVYALGQYVVASRVPLRGCEPGQIGYRSESHRYLRCTFDVRGTALTVVTAHFQSPRLGLVAARRQGADGADEWAENLADRQTQADRLAADVAALPRPLVVAGDLNAAEHSPVVRVLLRAGLIDAFSAGGRGYGFTYGQSMRAGLAFLRIDHILASRDITVADCFVGDGGASEHKPVIADLVLPR